MLIVFATVMAAGLYLQSPQSPEARAPQPLANLIDDLQAAIPRATLNAAQREQVRSDAAVLRTAREARQQDRPVDRGQVTAALKNLHGILESGAFPPEDRKSLNADIAALRKR